MFTRENFSIINSVSGTRGSYADYINITPSYTEATDGKMLIRASVMHNDDDTDIETFENFRIDKKTCKSISSMQYLSEVTQDENYVTVKNGNQSITADKRTVSYPNTTMVVNNTLEETPFMTVAYDVDLLARVYGK